tara:strand:+ start:3779 stop:3949 length:171 start_codon:yes stop_codon:yes gene_type:complete
MLQLLETGIPWESIENFSVDEVNIVLGILMAKNERQQEDQARQMSQQSAFKKMGGY